jgi:hypothetical protein
VLPGPRVGPVQTSTAKYSEAESPVDVNCKPLLSSYNISHVFIVEALAITLFYLATTKIK